MQIFRERFQELESRLLEMCHLVGDSLRLSVQSLSEKNIKLACRVIGDDAAVNRIEREIDELSVTLFTLSPRDVADIQLAITALKLSTGFERVGDLAVDIAERSILLIDTVGMADTAKQLQELTLVIEEMVSGIGVAFRDRDARQAGHVIALFAEVSSRREQIEQEPVHRLKADSAFARPAVQLFYILRDLQRVADHALNMAESVLSDVADYPVSTSALAGHEPHSR